ncbi:MAG: hypothetical protein ABII71_05670 [Candidatus Micrarchaeota archaeon]
MCRGKIELSKVKLADDKEKSEPGNSYEIEIIGSIPPERAVIVLGVKK